MNPSLPTPPADLSPPDWRGLCEELSEALCGYEITRQDAALVLRARAALAQPESEGRPAPVPAEGEVGELVEWLRCEADYQEFTCKRAPSADRIRRAADLLERQAAPVPAEGEVGDDCQVASDETMRRIRSTTKRWKVTLTITTNDSAIDTRLGVGIWKVLDTESEILESVSLPQLLTSTSSVLERRHAAPAPAGEVAEVAAWLRAYRDEEFGPFRDDPDTRWLTRAAELLERQAAPVPVAVSERLPEAGDCTANPRNGEGEWCWGWRQDSSNSPFSGRWRMVPRAFMVEESTHWLPAHALPLPSGEAQP